LKRQIKVLGVMNIIKIKIERALWFLFTALMVLLLYFEKVMIRERGELVTYFAIIDILLVISFILPYIGRRV